MKDMYSGILIAIGLAAACIDGQILSAQTPERVDQQAAAADDGDFFENKVRPLLVQHCWQCHGGLKEKGGLRLDSRANLLKGGESGPAVVPGRPTESLLIEAVRRKGVLKMPPKNTLQPHEVAILERWIQAGLQWPERQQANPPLSNGAKTHWAFQPIHRPAVPPVRHAAWPRSAIDRFILAEQEKRGLSPSEPADRRTLIRRVSLDLLGLPPSRSEIESFENDPSPEAWAKVVDRLLASAHYGERWGRYWLDIARYSDTKGYVFFEEPEYPWAYTYRDYVVRAFNTDVPYDQFILEQLAADRLTDGRGRQSLPALGFLTLGGRFMNNQHDILDDRIDVVARGLLGLTVSCARCHDHKFDPITMKDYYSLYGIFASCREPTVPPLFQDPPQTAEYAGYEKELARREGKLADFVRQKHEQLVNSSQTRMAEYLLAVRARQNQPTTEEFMLLADGGDLNPRMLIRWQAFLRRTSRAHHPVFALWHALARLPAQDFERQAAAVVRRMCTAAKPAINPLLAKAFLLSPPQKLVEAANLYSEVLNRVEQYWQDTIAYAQRTGRQAPVTFSDPAYEELRQVFHGPDSAPNITMNPVGDLDLLPDRASQAVLQELRKAVETWRVSGPGAPPRAMVLADNPRAHHPRVFNRGNPHNLGDPAPRAVPAVLSWTGEKPIQSGSGRLELARAIVDPSNPLTARVIVNRLWMHHFGAPLVRTPGDFGLRSEPPSHPELLDYLASDLIANGWSIKKLHRQVLLSATYQQESRLRPDCQRLDPENRWLWRMNRRRLDFEATRDTILAAAGALDHKVGGPPIRDIVSPANSRRTLYGFIDRLNLSGLYRTFDFPSPDATSPERSQTTVPPQALFFMNHPFVAAQARRLWPGSQAAASNHTATRIQEVFEKLFGRQPSGEELALSQEYLAAGGFSPAAWERFGQALLLSNELIFVD